MRYFGTTDKNPKKARLSPLWADENDLSILSYRTPAKRYKAVTAVIEPDLILGEVTLDNNKALSQESRATMEAKSLTMHVLKTKIVSKADRQLDQASKEPAKLFIHPDIAVLLQQALGRLNSKRKAKGQAEVTAKRAKTS